MRKTWHYSLYKGRFHFIKKCIVPTYKPEKPRQIHSSIHSFYFVRVVRKKDKNDKYNRTYAGVLLEVSFWKKSAHALGVKKLSLRSTGYAILNHCDSLSPCAANRT